MENNSNVNKSFKTYEGNLLSIGEQILNLGIEKIVLEDENTLNTVIAAISYYYWLNKDEESLSTIKQICENNRVNLDIRLFIYWQLVRIKFINSKELNNIDLSEIYETIFNSFNEKSKFKNTNKIKERNDNIAVLITNQFLGYEHAPTKALMNIAKTINDKYKQIDKIYIYNSTEMPSRAYCNFFQPFIFNCIEPYEQLLNETIKLAGIDRCEVYYYQNQNEISTLDRIESMLNDIYNLKPSLVISVGGSNILGDLCSDFTHVYTYGTTSEIPIAKTKYLVNFCEEESIIEYKVNDEQSFIGIPKGFYGLNIKKNNSYTRDSFGIPNDLFLISVVGNRLNEEITEEFIEMINNILSENENVGIVIIGNYNDSIIKSKIPKNIYNRIYLVGYIENLPEILSLTNMYLNPTRTGGGYSCLYAMMCDIPILTTDYGDVASYLSDDFKVNDYNEMFKLANTLINDNTIYNDMFNKMKKIHEKYEKIDWHILIDYILNKLEGGNL